MTLQTTGVYMLPPEHADAIQRLVSDFAVGATTRLPHSYPESSTHDFITRQLREREEGRSHVFVIKDRPEVVGLCGLHGIENSHSGDLDFWVGRPFCGKGYASFGVKMVCSSLFRICGSNASDRASLSPMQVRGVFWRKN